MFIPPSHIVKNPFPSFLQKNPAAENAKGQDHRMHQPSQLEPKADAGAIQTMGPNDVKTQHWQNDVVHRHLGDAWRCQGKAVSNILPHQKKLLYIPCIFDIIHINLNYKIEQQQTSSFLKKNQHVYLTTMVFPWVFHGFFQGTQAAEVRFVIFMKSCTCAATMSRTSATKTRTVMPWT
jgi:hypothetical protein